MYWSVFYRDVTKKNIELAHELGDLAVNVWTVNRESDIIRMIEYGVMELSPITQKSPRYL